MSLGKHAKIIMQFNLEVHILLTFPLMILSLFSLFKYHSVPILPLNQFVHVPTTITTRQEYRDRAKQERNCRENNQHDEARMHRNWLCAKLVGVIKAIFRLLSGTNIRGSRRVVSSAQFRLRRRVSACGVSFSDILIARAAAASVGGLTNADSDSDGDDNRDRGKNDPEQLAGRVASAATVVLVVLGIGARAARIGLSTIL